MNSSDNDDQVEKLAKLLAETGHRLAHAGVGRWASRDRVGGLPGGSIYTLEDEERERRGEAEPVWGKLCQQRQWEYRVLARHLLANGVTFAAPPVEYVPDVTLDDLDDICPRVFPDLGALLRRIWKSLTATREPTPSATRCSGAEHQLHVGQDEPLNHPRCALTGGHEGPCRE